MSLRDLFPRPRTKCVCGEARAFRNTVAFKYLPVLLLPNHFLYQPRRTRPDSEQKGETGNVQPPHQQLRIAAQEEITS